MRAKTDRMVTQFERLQLLLTGWSEYNDSQVVVRVTQVSARSGTPVCLSRSGLGPQQTCTRFLGLGALSLSPTPHILSLFFLKIFYKSTHTAHNLKDGANEWELHNI